MTLPIYIQPPKFLFLELNAACNLRCGHCMYWKNDENDKLDWMPISLRSDFISEFAAMGGKNLVSCGGEPLLAINDWFQVAKKARENNLRFLSVTNGSLFTEDIARKAVECGPHEITISIDGLKPVHDKARGTIGSFDKAIQSLRWLLKHRKDTKVYSMTIVSERNYRQLPDLCRFLMNDVGVDRTKLNFLQPTFGAGGIDTFFSKELIGDVNDLMHVINHIDEEHGFNWSNEWKRVVRLYHESAKVNTYRGWQHKGTSEVICNSAERNIMLNRYGVARLCFSHKFAGKRLTARGDLTRYWNGNTGTRERMRSCTALCGISHSVRKANASSNNYV